MIVKFWFGVCVCGVLVGCLIFMLDLFCREIKIRKIEAC